MIPQTYFRASAPGSMMLFGEHAVLHGSAAIVTAISQRLTVTLTPRIDQRVIIDAEQFGTFEGHILDLQPMPPYHFVLAAINTCHQQSPLTGCDIKITSEIPTTVGFGSSAAATVATLAVLKAWQQQPLSLQNLAKLAREVILQQQGKGSGADAVASVYGGTLFYQPQPWHVESLPPPPQLSVYYSGYKTKTVDVIDLISKKQKAAPERYQHLYQKIATCVILAKRAFLAKDWPAVGALMTHHQQLQKDLGTSDKTLDKMIETLLAQPTVMGAKISGSGLGDCVVALGSSEVVVGETFIPVQCASSGVLLHVD